MTYLLDYFVRRQCFADTLKPSNAAAAVDVRRLDRIGPLTVLASVACVLFVRFIAVRILQPDPSFVPFNVLMTAFDTTVLVSFAVRVFRHVAALAVDPIGTFKTIAMKALLLSFLPDVAIAVARLPGATLLNVAVLIAEHIAAWAVCVSILTRFTTRDD